MGASGPVNFSTTLLAMDAADHADALLAVLGSSARNQPERALAHIKPCGRPLAVFAAPQADVALALFEANGIAAFRTPEACADALGAYLSWRGPIPAVEAVLPEATRTALAGGEVRLNEMQACDLFATLGITPPGARVVRDAAGAAGMAGPVAVKVLSPDILHKTEAGLVFLNVPGEGIGAAIADIHARMPKGARFDGILVSPMHKGLAEVILGYRRDPEVGPVVVLGVGGVLAEIRRSIAVRLAPVSLEDAHAMIAEVPELRVLSGYRNLPRGDVAALARAVRDLSLLALATGVSEAEINPMIVKAEGQGCVAVDGLLVRDLW